MSSASPVPVPATIVVTNPSGQRKKIPLTRVPFRIGRQADNDIVIRDNRASRHHARIIFEDGSYWVEDLESSHGVWVNGARVSRRRLAGGELIGFGYKDSYDLNLMLEEGDLNRVLGRLPASLEAESRPLAKLRAVVEVARAIQSQLTTGEVLDSVVDAALAVTGTERGFLLLRSGDELAVRVARDRSGAAISDEDLRVPARLIHRALRDRREMLSMNFDPNAEQGVRPEGTVASLELRSVVCVPLVRVRTGELQETVHSVLNDTVGVIYLDSRMGVADLSSGNRELLQSLAIEASTVLENARLLEEERSRQRLQEELNIARTIQESLLPKKLPTTGWFRASGASIASSSVGGDYFDAIPVSPDRWITMVADVSGKGVSSALLAALLQGAFLRAAHDARDVREMLERMNRFLVERTEGEKYATLFYSILSADGNLIWTNAAHVAPVLLRGGGKTELLEPSGMPVGLLEAATYEVCSTSLLPGDKLVICSDGLTEARNEQDQFFEMKRLRAAVSANWRSSAAEMQELLLAELREFTGNALQNDDITLVVVEYQPDPNGS